MTSRVTLPLSKLGPVMAKKRFLPLALVLWFLPFCCSGGTGGGISWETDYSEALGAAIDQEKPMMAYFTTSW